MLIELARMMSRTPYTGPVFIIILVLSLLDLSKNRVRAAPSLSDGLVQNITRLDKGDAFFVAGNDCGVTKCGEVSGGTALSERPPGGSGGCACRCRGGLPLYREDRGMCVAQVAECPMAQFGAGDGATRVPLIFLPLFGQIIHPSKEIYFRDVDKTACAVTSAMYLTRTGWGNLREELDNDVPFSLYRDEGRTYLMWRGSENMRNRVTGRAVVVKLACRSDHHVVLPCVAFRVQGTPPDLPNEIPAVFFSREDMNPTPSRNHAASLGTTLLLCALVGTLIYAGAFVLYMRHKRQRLLEIGNGKGDDHSITDMPNTTTNPLLSLSSLFTDSRTSECEMLSDKEDSSRSYSSRSSSMADSLDRQNQQDLSDGRGEDDDTDSEISATVHHVNRAKSATGFCMPVLVERRPEVHVNIVEDLEPSSRLEKMTCQVPPNGNVRKKLYFNPVFLESHMLKHPPPAAIEFLTKIREVIALAKEKMLSKRFIPLLPAISEERFCYEVDMTLNSDLFKNKYTAHSLKRENSRRRNYCSGCPGCKHIKLQDIFRKTLSEKDFCKSCATTDLKDTIVRKWLDRIPIIETISETENVCESTTSQVRGIPKSIKPKHLEDETNLKRRKRKEKIALEVEEKEHSPSIQPPPPPVRSSSISKKSDTNLKEESVESKNKSTSKRKDDDILNIPISPELKKKMNAVINELSKFRRIEPIVPRVPSPVSEVATPFIPKLIIPVTPKVINNINVQSHEDAGRKRNIHMIDYEIDSLERTNIQRRTAASNIQNSRENQMEVPRNKHKRRASIIPMDKLEPMKKIQEMNSRLSKNFNDQVNKSNKEVEKTNDLTLKCKSYTIQRSNLVSEVYINDFINTMSSASDSEYSSPNSSIIHIGDTPSNTPSQLVIEVESIPETKSVFEEEYFDPDTLDRKPSAGRFLHGPIIKPKNIDHIFLKSPASFKEETFKLNEVNTNSESDKSNFLDFVKYGHNVMSNDHYNCVNINNNYSKTIDNRSSVNGGKIIFYENCVFNNHNNVLNSGSRSLSEIFLEKKEEIKPPLPPKKTVGKKYNFMHQLNTSRISINDPNCNDKNLAANNTYRITRSEPPQINTFIEVDEKTEFHRPLILEVKQPKQNVRNYSSFDVNKDKVKDQTEFISLDPNYDYYSTYEYKKYDTKQDSVNGDNKTNEPAFKRQNKRSSKYRSKHLSKHNKTEDSGYLSSDSNESRQKAKFILQVRDKDTGIKDTVSDTDDLESIGDARSESGAESIETNSVFFGSLRMLSSIRKAQEMRNGFSDDSKGDGLKASDGCKELKNVISITSPRERLAALDDL